MTAIRVLRAFMALALLVMTSVAAAQSADLQKQLESAYPLTKATADSTDIVTAGAVLVLQKDNLQMCPVNLPIPTPNYYKNGSISQGGVISFLNKIGNASMGGGADGTKTRTFVAGEKFWVTKIQIQNDGVTFQLLTDPFQDVRYHSSLKVPFPKGQTPSSDQVLATMGQVIKTDGGSGTPEPEQQQAAADAPAPAAAAPDTKTISLGQTKDQVVQSFGQPTKVVQLGKKEIDYYTDMKVTFTNNKVTNVE